MTKTCNHHFLVNQEKGEKHVFRKSKKYSLSPKPTTMAIQTIPSVNYLEWIVA